MSKHECSQAEILAEMRADIKTLLADKWLIRGIVVGTSFLGSMIVTVVLKLILR